jgi:hypothetical protein
MIKTTYNDLVDSQRRYVKKEEKSASASRSISRDARLSSPGLAKSWHRGSGGRGASLTSVKGPTGLGLWPAFWSG